VSAFRRTRGVAAAGLLVAAALTFAACGGDDDEEEADPGGGTPVAATLGGDAGEYAITVDPTSAPAGDITFGIVNEGELEHEFEVFSGTVDPASVPIEEDRANFEGLDVEEIDEVEDLAGGDEAQLTVDLAAAEYLLVCNLPGHFAQGMYTTFTVE